MFIFLFMTDLFMSDLFITNTKDRPCISPPYISLPLYKPIKKRLRKYVSPGLIVGGLRYLIANLLNFCPINSNQLPPGSPQEPTPSRQHPPDECAGG